MSFVTTARSSRELFINFTLRELRSKYKRSFLGWAWSLANPLANMFVYTIVFSVFLKAPLQPGANGLHVYALFLLCALLPWNFFSGGLMGCIGSLVANGALIKKSYFPRQLLPAATVAAALVSHLIEMGLLVLALACFGDWQAVALLPFTLVLIAIMAVFCFGLGLALSALNVYFRDIQHFMTIWLLVWVYLTPIVYPITAVPARFRGILKINPMTDMALCFRSVLYDGQLPGVRELAYFAGWAVALFAIGIWVFRRFSPRLAEEL